MPDEKRKWWQVLQGWLNAADPTRDVRLLAFSAVVAAAIVWLTREQARGPIKAEWVDAFKWLLISTSLAGVGGPVLDMLKGGASAKQNQATGTQDEKGSE